MSNPSQTILRLAQPPARRFVPGLAAGVLSAVSAVALLACSAWLITRAAEMPPILYLNMAVVGVRAFALGRSAFRYLERLLSHDAAFRQLTPLRVGMLERIIPLAPAGLASTGRGDLLARLVRDVDDLQDLPLRVVQPLVTAGIVAVLSVIGVCTVMPAAGLALAVCLVLGAVLGTVISGLVAASSERSIAPLRGALTNEVLEVVENLDVLVAFGALETRLSGLADADDRLRRASARRAFGVGIQAALMSLFAGAATVAALVVGIPLLGGGAEGSGINGPALAVIVLVPLAVFEVFAAIPAALGVWRQVRSSATRVAEAVPETVPAEIPVDVAAASAAVLPDLAAGTAPLIELRGLSARWPGHTEPAVSGINLTLAPGDRVHLAGRSGSGKTTIAHALVRFLDYTGSYRVGGVEAHELTQQDVRRVVGLCEQTPWLFDDSIRQNLLFARETATDDELLAVLDRVGLGEWTASHGGLEAPVGQRGALVSGGQAQRIALARAILADFPVFVVDEPTANVDTELADRLVRDILQAAGEDRAVLLISHTPVPAELITARLDVSRV
ncbi:thiol reductant ABC exporter subunit CydC [Glaciibacter psychrotolerans]|uniref:ATP-binding cassette subfamily C protein CydC n=1 Tax=Glaciibacter psychrotolerans TaxID=670054 RepID=A0A7Z0J587_9MICO|nr:thiol reductant ABC exporter subunit CydC [Leifsonia psychrotolerans]NYJ18846.1 ATP-binding cassette subfamily C protein CydC [Leifsonia psychrotolerans]